jgi:hypothetical protein
MARIGRGLGIFCVCYAATGCAPPARAELVSWTGSGGALRAVSKIDGKSYEIALTLARPAPPAPPGALFLETAADDDVAPFALSRGMSVARLDLAALPVAARAVALRDIAPRLRGLAGGKTLLARGRGEDAAPLAGTGALFDGLLLQDAPGLATTAPRLVETWGSDAYWLADAQRPGPAPRPRREAENRRSYFLAGVAQATKADNCAAPVNRRSPAPALRALLDILAEWARGVTPPPSRAPAPADLVEAAALVWPKIAPGPPAHAGLVPAVDADGNERAGLRLPDHVLPIATFTAFNAQKDRSGPACRAGAAAPFAATKADREKSGDPRLSLVERYGSRAYFVATMRVVADRLVKERLLLREDADAYVAAAKQAPF